VSQYTYLFYNLSFGRGYFNLKVLLAMKKLMVLVIKIFVLVILAILLLGFLNKTEAQIFYSEISKERYNKITSGNSYQKAKVLYHDGTIEEGFVARIPDSSIIRFRESMEKGTPTKTLTERHVASFMYGLPKFEYPQFVYKDIDIRERKTKIRPVEIVSKGKIMIYKYTWVEFQGGPLTLSSTYTYNLNVFLEKDGIMYRMDNFKDDVVPLIKDKKEVFMEYKKIKHRKADYGEYINIVNLYNETE
jgi:hypothetical protein